MTADNFTPHGPNSILYFATLLFIGILSKKIGPAKFVFAHAISNMQSADNSNSHFNQKNLRNFFEHSFTSAENSIPVNRKQLNGSTTQYCYLECR